LKNKLIINIVPKRNANTNIQKDV